MTVKRTSLGDIVSTKFRTEANELGVMETWEDVTISTGVDISDTSRMRIAGLKEGGVFWPKH